LVERNLAKVEVESSRLFARSSFRKSSAAAFSDKVGKREACASLFFGALAKRLCSGLQIRLDRFDSGTRLQDDSPASLVPGLFCFAPRPPRRFRHPFRFESQSPAASMVKQVDTADLKSAA
jgi:hypothetical protein